jgi:DNA uptake protein ComE-like DNA-binding protein
MNTNASPPQTARQVHIACYVLMAAILTYAAVEHFHRPLAIGDAPGVDPARIAQVETRINPNIADWADLARLPGIGENLARQIVAYREGRLARARATTTAPICIFRCMQDLDPIPGLGEKKLQRMEPYLHFPEPE